MIKAVFFDLDGTLVPCDTNEFIRGYFKLLAKYMIDHDLNVDVSRMPGDIMEACYKVMKNDGTMTNKERFWLEFFKLYPMSEKEGKEFMRSCDWFYETKFDDAKYLLSPKDPYIDDVIEYLNECMLIKVLATSPVFPRAATNKRVNWIGHEYEEFDHITTYDNCIFCKPSLEYYRELLRMFALKGEEVLMVGNDMNEDIKPAKALKMQTFFIDSFPLNDDGTYSGPRGTFKDLLAYLKEIMKTAQ